MKTLIRVVFWVGIVVLVALGIKKLRQSRRNRAASLVRASLVSDVSKANAAWIKVSGVTFNGRQRLLEQLYPGDTLTLEHMPVEGHPEGVAVFNPKHEQLGFISIDRDMAMVVSRLIDAGITVNVVDFERVGGENLKPRLGLRIKLEVAQ